MKRLIRSIMLFALGLSVFAPLCLGQAYAGGRGSHSHHPHQPAPPVSSAPRPHAPQAQRPISQAPQAPPQVSLPPEVQRMVNTALQALPPDRREATLTQLRAVPPTQLSGMAQVMVQIVRALPPNAQQRFVNGIFEVSPADAQFSNRVVQQALQQVQLQYQQSEQIVGTLNRIYEGNRATIGGMQDATRSVGDMWWHSLGGDCLYQNVWVSCQ